MRGENGDEVGRGESAGLGAARAWPPGGSWCHLVGGSGKVHASPHRRLVGWPAEPQVSTQH